MGGTPAGAPLLFGPPPCRHWGFYLYLILIEHFHVRFLIDEGVNGMENTSHPFSGRGGRLQFWGIRGAALPTPLELTPGPQPPP